MASMRVSELAKELGLTSKELMAHLGEMKIPFKTHSSTLVDAYIDKIRKNLGPELEKRAAEAKVAKEAAEAAEKAQEEQVKAEAAAAREAAAEQERAKRDKERAEREAQDQQEAAAIEVLTQSKSKKPAPANEAQAQKDTTVPKQPKKFSGLLSQIEAEKARLAAKAAKSAPKAAPEVAPEPEAKPEVKVDAKTEDKPKKPAKANKGKKGKAANALTAKDANKDAGKDVAKVAGKPAGKEVGKETSKDADKDTGKGATQPKLTQAEEDERYRQMALAAEKLQREKVLIEARAAVEAASSEGEGKRKKRKEKRAAEKKEQAQLEAIEKGIDPDLALDDSVVQITTGVTVQEFADALDVPSNDIVKRLFMLGTPLTVTQTMTDDLVELIADDLARVVQIQSPEEEFAVVYNDDPSQLIARSPVVTVMGHVDHGKTSLLDAIRESGVVATEAGGITQHIGASVAMINDRQITFIDTPGHEAFTAMRARGAKLTDVVVLVVAADDGVMPQTVEAINHAKAAEVPIVVAVNKIDKDGATPERVRQELTEHEIIPEEWGGKNMFVDVSAKQRVGIDELLETILLQSDVLELQANPDTLASGFVIEAKLDKGRGPVATVLVQRGTLKVGDTVVVGSTYGRVRALVSPSGENIKSARPADPAEIVGLSAVPEAGDEFRVFAEEREARNLAEDRALRKRLAEQRHKSHVTLEDLFDRIEEGKMTELNLVVKADVQGSIEALQDALNKMDQSEVRINVIHSAVGGITETDVTLAAASDAIIIGFNVRPQPKAKAAAEKEQVEIKTYRVIYQAIEDINAARVGLLRPDIVEEDTGSAEVRETFKVPKIGTVAGCLVFEGEISRDDKARVVRDGTVIFEGNLASLRRFKDDVKAVKSGYECGIGVENFPDVKIGDTIECYKIVEIAREE